MPFPRLGKIKEPDDDNFFKEWNSLSERTWKMLWIFPEGMFLSLVFKSRFVLWPFIFPERFLFSCN